MRAIGLLCLFVCASLADTVFFVSSKGEAIGKGTAAEPFGMIEQARDAIRNARKETPDGRYTVVLQNGCYLRKDSLVLTEADSGTIGNPVVYRAETPGQVSLYGGIVLAKETFKPCTDSDVLRRLHADVRSKVHVADVSAIIKGPLKDVAPAFRGVITAPFFYVGGQPQTLARWPNMGAWASFSNAVDHGIEPVDPTFPERPRRSHPGAFVLDDTRPAGWNIQEGVWLHGYWTHDWFDEILKVGGYDRDSKVIRLAAPHTYGIAQQTWGGKERRFYALNLLEELDAPGEWYLDRKGKRFYYYFEPDQATDAEMVLTTLQKPLVNAVRVRHLVFQDLIFSYNHSHGIQLQACEAVAIKGCRISNMAQNGVMISGNGNLIRSCDLFNIGATGIQLEGGDRRKLVNGRNVAENNHVYRFGQFARTYAGAFGVSGCGNIVRNNVIHDAPHLAILYSGNEHRIELNEIYNVLQETGDAGAIYTGRDWTSQGNVVQYNYLHDLGGGGQGQSSHIMGIYLDDCDSGDTLHGNLFYQAGRAFLVGGGRDNRLTGNLVVDCVIGLHIDSRGMSWKQWNQPGTSWALQEKAEAMDYKNPPWSTRYPHLAKTLENAPREPIGNVLQDNVILNTRQEALHFDKGVRAVFAKFACTNNLVVDTTGTNRHAQLTFALDGFRFEIPSAGTVIDFRTFESSRKFRSFKKNGWLMARMPSLNEIPVEKIGCFNDEFRGRNKMNKETNEF